MSDKPPRKRGRPFSERPERLCLDYFANPDHGIAHVRRLRTIEEINAELLAEESAVAPVGCPRRLQISDDDLRGCVEELERKGASRWAAVKFVASYVVSDALATEIEELHGLDPSAAWDRAQDALAADPEEAKRKVLRAADALRKRI